MQTRTKPARLPSIKPLSTTCSPPFHSLHRSCPLPLTKAFAKLSNDTKLVILPSDRPLLENLKVAISCSVVILEQLRQG